MDDILTFTKTIEENYNIIDCILAILERNKLTLQSKKYQFHKTKIDYLDVIISKDSAEVDPTKIKGVTEWLEPKDKQEIQQFLGFCNFYKHFIKGFAHITKLLTELTRKREWRWSIKEQGAFEKLEKRMTTAPVLVVPDNEHKF